MSVHIETIAEGHLDCSVGTVSLDVHRRAKPGRDDVLSCVLRVSESRDEPGHCARLTPDELDRTIKLLNFARETMRKAGA